MGSVLGHQLRRCAHQHLGLDGPEGWGRGTDRVAPASAPKCGWDRRALVRERGTPAHLPHPGAVWKRYLSYSTHPASTGGAQHTRDCDSPYTGVSSGLTTNLWWQDFPSFIKEPSLNYRIRPGSQNWLPSARAGGYTTMALRCVTRKTGQNRQGCFSVTRRWGWDFI